MRIAFFSVAIVSAIQLYAANALQLGQSSDIDEFSQYSQTEADQCFYQDDVYSGDNVFAQTEHYDNQIALLTNKLNLTQHKLKN